jgi:hypothetical protein
VVDEGPSSCGLESSKRGIDEGMGEPQMQVEDRLSERADVDAVANTTGTHFKYNNEGVDTEIERLPFPRFCLIVEPEVRPPDFGRGAWGVGCVVWGVREEGVGSWEKGCGIWDYSV